MPHLDEETIKARFVTALNAIIESKDIILEDCRLMQATLTDCTGIDTEIESLLEEIDVVTELTECADSSREWDGKMERLLHLMR